jgi:3'-5' exonuclease
MARIIFDIETAGFDFESLEGPVQEYLLKWAETEDKKNEVRESLSFYPLTAEIVSIGMLNPDTGKGAVFFQNNGASLPTFEEEGIRYESGDETEVLHKFWDTIKSYSQFITFNGRGFDCPFIMVRSAVHKIKPVRDLLPNRYGDIHIDLLDQLTFYGAARRKFSLDMWCRSFGIKSPKEDGITGYDVKDLYRSGRGLDIAKYCTGDLKSTAELFFVWENYIKFTNHK